MLCAPLQSVIFPRQVDELFLSKRWGILLHITSTARRINAGSKTFAFTTYPWKAKSSISSLERWTDKSCRIAFLPAIRVMNASRVYRSSRSSLFYDRTVRPVVKASPHVSASRIECQYGREERAISSRCDHVVVAWTIPRHDLQRPIEKPYVEAHLKERAHMSEPEKGTLHRSVIDAYACLLATP